MKLTTRAQVTLLSEGNVLHLFPCNCADGPEEEFDELRSSNIRTYGIRSINAGTDVYLLVSANFHTQFCLGPADIGRLYISGYDVIEQKVWWINS